MRNSYVVRELQYTLKEVKIRFWLGLALGWALGLITVVTCYVVAQF